MRALDVTAEEIDIRPAASRMLEDIGHPFAGGDPVYDVTFENVQAGLRTDYLFRLANQREGLVVGTGDLSELALGWCTYGVGDQMSHYGVNAGVPKTLIQFLIRWCIRTDQYDAATHDVLTAILATEISPELVPAGADGAIQSTEARIGPYALKRFLRALRRSPRHGAIENRVPRLACLAGRGGGPLAGRFPGRRAGRLRPADDRGLAGEVPGPLLHDQSVQAVGDAQRTQGIRRGCLVAARRLARAVRRYGAGLGRGTDRCAAMGAQRSTGMSRT